MGVAILSVLRELMHAGGSGETAMRSLSSSAAPSCELEFLTTAMRGSLRSWIKPYPRGAAPTALRQQSRRRPKACAQRASKSRTAGFAPVRGPLYAPILVVSMRGDLSSVAWQ